MESQILKNVPMFSALSDENIEKIAPLLKKQKYKKNTMILMEDDSGDSLFVIEDGSVKITRYSEDGREVILSILGEGDFFGEMSILDGESRSANVVALENSEICILSRDDLLDILEKYPSVAIALLEELALRLRKSDQHIEGLSLSDAESRVAMSIIRISEQLGKIKKGQVIIEKLPFQHDIANMAGTSRETVSRVLRILEEKQHITKNGRKLLIVDYSEFIKKFG